MRTRLALAPVVLLAGLSLAACSSTATTTDAPASASDGPSFDEADDTPLGSDPTTWAPQMIQPGEVSKVVDGQFLILGGLPQITHEQHIDVATSDKHVVTLEQTGPDSYAMVEAMNPGEATISVYLDSDFDKEHGAMTGDPIATYDIEVLGEVAAQ